MARKYQDFDEGDQGGFFEQALTIVSNNKRGFAVASVVAAVVLLGVVVFGGYPENEEYAANESVPIVRADAGGYKTTPDNPGGMEIPHRDSTIFGAGSSAGPENILAEETREEPVPRSQLFAGLNTEGEAGVGEMEANQQFAKAEPVQPALSEDLIREAIGVPAAEEAPVAIAPAPAVPAPVKTATATTTAPEAVKPAPVEKASEAEAKNAAKIESAAGAAVTAAKAPSTTGTHYIQVASVKSTAGAAAEFKKLQAKYPGLAAMSYRTQEANLGAKGVFYRIQAGPLSRDEANRICNQMKKAAPGSCLVVAK